MDNLSKLIADKAHREQAIYFFVVAVVIIVELAMVVWYVPRTVQQIAESIQKSSQLSGEIAQTKQINALLAKSDRQLLASRLTKATAALPDIKETSGLISGMTRLASSSGAVVEAIAFSPGTVSSGSAMVPVGNVPNSDVQIVPATLTMSTNFDQLIDFLTKLNSAEQLIGVTGVEYGYLEGSQGTAANIALAVYFLPPLDKVQLSDVKLLNDAQGKTVDALSKVNIFKLQ